MARKINSKETIADGNTVQNIWIGIPEFKMGNIGVKDFNASYAEAVALDQDYNEKDLELTGIRERRDDTLRYITQLVSRFRSGMRSTYGPDSPEYQQAGGTRTSNRKPPKRKQQIAPTVYP